MEEIIRFDLRENAYDFLNESLRAAGGDGSKPRWKFAVLHMVQAIELLLKARLHAEHRILVYEHLERRGRTVSLRQAVERIEGATEINLTPKERRVLRKATEWRDAIVHHEVGLPLRQVESVYLQLFEFFASFHDRYCSFGDSHDRVDRPLWEFEASLIERFKRELVVYNGVVVHRSTPADVMDAQRITTIDLDAEMFERLPYGVEPAWEVNADLTPCHDCGVVEGMVHDFGCDVEACPRCFRQLITCGCLWGEGPSDGEITSLDAEVARARAFAERMTPEHAARLRRENREFSETIWSD